MILTIAAFGLYVGWKAFWFLTDDAFIAFRYVNNGHLGLGYVWNAPPFHPVEGYTSFLWIVLLDGVWRVLGVAPPVAANWLALCFSAGTLGVSAWMALQIKLDANSERFRWLWLSLILLGALTNRTFLAWTSSGLETSLFNFWVTLWVGWILFSKAPPTRFGIALSAIAAAIYLTRPDGMLFILATLVFLATQRGRPWTWAPLLAVPVHLGWRRLIYDEWLPNTYYAKYIGAWPESGIRYLLSFLIEYGLWVWAALALGAVLTFRWSALRPSFKHGRLLLAVAPIFLHLFYYTFVIGGDHFEYRVYSHLVPLIFVSLVALAQQLALGARGTTIALLATLAWGAPIPWTHWALSRHHYEHGDRRELLFLKIPVAPAMPRAFRWYARPFDELQAWLIDHSVCMRHQEHKAFWLYQARRFPARSEGMKVSSRENPVYATMTVGIPGWTLPKVAILDTMGLNDWVGARSPPVAGPRQMAHGRIAPREYVSCLDPNVALDAEGRVSVRKRDRPLDAERIVHCESYFRARILGLAD